MVLDNTETVVYLYERRLHIVFFFFVFVLRDFFVIIISLKPERSFIFFLHLRTAVYSLDKPGLVTLQLQKMRKWEKKMRVRTELLSSKSFPFPQIVFGPLLCL